MHLFNMNCFLALIIFNYFRAFGVVLWEIAELGKLPYENLSDEDVLQKVLIDKNLQLSPPTSEMICKDEM